MTRCLVTGGDEALWRAACTFSGADWTGWQDAGEGRSTYLADVPDELTEAFTRHMAAAVAEVTWRPGDYAGWPR